MHKLLIYTLEEGGEFKMLADFVDERGYLEIKRRGWFDVRFGDYPQRIYPAYIAFAVVAADYDFHLAEIRAQGEQGHI